MQKELPARKKIRLEGYDYSSAGAYFITICTHDKLNLFGKIVGADLVSARDPCDPCEIASARMILNAAGQMAEKIFIETINSFEGFSSDKYIIMPNHMHCIINISQINVGSRAGTGSRGNAELRENAGSRADTRSQESRADTRSAPTGMKTVSDVIQAYKSKTTTEYINGVKSGLFPQFNKRIWQHRFHDHIIRNEADYQRIWQYIDENPVRWTKDKYYESG